jgi:Protein of unknown function (DUF3499)
VYTLTYVYRDSTAVLGPLAAYVEPHSYDRADDLEALANAVMDNPPRPRPDNRLDKEPVGQGVEVGRRGHLRVLRSGPPQDR